MTLITFLFYFFIGTTALSAFALLFLKNIFHAALALLTCLLSIAALFILLQAEFLAVSQILLYAGGVVILIIFGIMLTNKAGGQAVPITNTGLLPGIAVGAGVFFLLLFFVRTSLFSVRPSSQQTIATTPIEGIGIEILTDYVLPFELAGVLLLAVLIGAATLAGFKQVKN
jgi:NADH:ubiquinone oxidoreductase subunit 6 (subunit J)